MSWEVIRTNKIKCLCGKGQIKQDLLGDDWNRYEDGQPVIECEECSKKYSIISETSKSKPYHEHTTYFCVNKETGEKTAIEL